MVTEKNLIRTEAAYDESHNRRYHLHICWNKDRPCAVVIMLSAGSTDGICFDRTTTYCMQNLLKLGFGSVEIVNLFSAISNRNSVLEDCEDQENLKAIQKALNSTETVIYAVGTGKEKNKQFQKRRSEVLELLKAYQGKLFCIADKTGRKFYHPLCPKVQEWKLEPWALSDLQ